MPSFSPAAIFQLLLDKKHSKMVVKKAGGTQPRPAATKPRPRSEESPLPPSKPVQPQPAAAAEAEPAKGTWNICTDGRHYLYFPGLVLSISPGIRLD